MSEPGRWIPKDHFIDFMVLQTTQTRVLLRSLSVMDVDLQWDPIKALIALAGPRFRACDAIVNHLEPNGQEKILDCVQKTVEMLVANESLNYLEISCPRYEIPLIQQDQYAENDTRFEAVPDEILATIMDPSPPSPCAPSLPMTAAKRDLPTDENSITSNVDRFMRNRGLTPSMSVNCIFTRNRCAKSSEKAKIESSERERETPSSSPNHYISHSYSEI